MRVFIFILFGALLFAEKDNHYISCSAGAFDVTTPEGQFITSAFGIEYIPPVKYYTVRPLIGAFITGHTSTYINAGISFEWIIVDKVLVNPGIAVGWYNKGSGKDLHFPLEFRSSIALAWVFDNLVRIGLRLHHLSNAGISDPNPGVEVLTLFLAVPF